MIINRVLTQRLISLYDPFHALGLPRILQLGSIKPRTYSATRNAGYDLGRIRSFVDMLECGLDLQPIEVDNVCCNGHVLPEPWLLDGHHRLIAYAIAERQRIPCQYGGRIDLLRYLEGKRQTCPQG